jgi:hypothetical protein
VSSRAKSFALQKFAFLIFELPRPSPRRECVVHVLRPVRDVRLPGVHEGHGARVLNHGEGLKGRAGLGLSPERELQKLREYEQGVLARSPPHEVVEDRVQYRGLRHEHLGGVPGEAGGGGLALLPQLGHEVAQGEVAEAEAGPRLRRGEVGCQAAAGDRSGFTLPGQSLDMQGDARGLGTRSRGNRQAGVPAPGLLGGALHGLPPIRLAAPGRSRVVVCGKGEVGGSFFLLLFTRAWGKGRENLPPLSPCPQPMAMFTRSICRTSSK